MFKFKNFTIIGKIRTMIITNFSPVLFKDIIVNENAVKHLLAEVKNDRIGHAQIPRLAVRWPTRGDYTRNRLEG